MTLAANAAEATGATTQPAANPWLMLLPLIIPIVVTLGGDVEEPEAEAEDSRGDAEGAETEEPKEPDSRKDAKTPSKTEGGNNA